MKKVLKHNIVGHIANSTKKFHRVDDLYGCKIPFSGTK